MGVDDLNDIITRRYQRFIEHATANEPNAAAEEFARLCNTLRRTELRITRRMLTGFHVGFIDFFWQIHRFDMMLQAADDAERLFGEDPEWRFARGEAQFHLGRFDEAWATLEALTQEDFEDPQVYYMLACIAERRGEDSVAARLFQVANQLDANDYQIPLPLSEEDAIKQYEACLKELPETIAWRMREVPIYISPFPSDDLLKSLPEQIDPLSLGLFMGTPVGVEAGPYASDQPRILLFHKNIAKVASDFESLEEELRKTVLHEVGHYLGFDEDQLEEMGLA